MGRVSWYGSPRRLLTVGDSGLYDYTSTQAALDFITDSASDNGYVIATSKEWETLTSPIHVLKSFVAIVAEPAAAAGYRVTGTSPADSAIWIGEDMDDNTTPGDGGERGCKITAPDALVESVSFHGLRITWGGGVGSRTATAIRVGNCYNLASRVPYYRTWDRVGFFGCEVISSEACLRVEGINNIAYETPPEFTIRNCRLSSAIQGVCLQGSLRYESSGNLIVSDTDLPNTETFLDDTAAGRQYGLLVNPSNARDSSWAHSYDTVVPGSLLRSVNDRYEVEDGTRTPGTGGSAQDMVFGVGIYQQNPTHAEPLSLGTGLGAIPVELISPTIRVRYNYADDKAREVFGAGICATPDGTTAYGAGWKGEMTITGGLIEVANELDHVDGQDEVFGVLCRGGTADTPPTPPPYWRTIYVDGTTVRASNAKAGAAAYSLSTDSVPDSIEAEVYSDQTTSSPRGSITGRGTKP